MTQTYLSEASGQPSLADSFDAIRRSLQTPETIGQALIDYLLSNATTAGVMTADGARIEVPITATLSVPGGGDGVVRAGGACSSICLQVLDHNIACVQVCVHEQ